MFQVSDLNKQLQRQLKETNASLRSAEAAAKESAEHLANLDHGKSAQQREMDDALQEATAVIESNEEELALARQSISDMEKALQESEAFVYSLAAALAEAGDQRGIDLLKQIQQMEGS